jgi:hypothetical protein
MASINQRDGFVNPRLQQTAVQTLKGLGQAGRRVSGQFVGGPRGCNFANSNKSAEERGDFVAGPAEE